MLGKLSSVTLLVAALKPYTANYAITEFKQGSTRRWGLAWSFGDWRPCQFAERYGSSHVKGIMPFPTEMEFEVPGGLEEVGGLVGVLGEELGAWVEGGEGRVVVGGEVAGNVWRRAARRAKARGEVEEGGVKLGFRVEVERRAEGCGVRVRWTRGVDSVLFESFCGMVRRRLREGVSAKE